MTTPFANADQLAPHIHEFYRALARKEGWTIKYDTDFDSLPPEIKADNIAAAKRIPDVLALAGLHVVLGNPPSSLSPEQALAIINSYLELLAEPEHNGWMNFKLRSGWKFGPKRDDDSRIHNLLVPYAQLSEKEKEKDRNAVRSYPAILARAGMAIAR